MGFNTLIYFSKNNVKNKKFMLVDTLSSETLTGILSQFANVAKFYKIK